MADLSGDNLSNESLENRSRTTPLGNHGSFPQTLYSTDPNNPHKPQGKKSCR